LGLGPQRPKLSRLHDRSHWREHFGGRGGRKLSVFLGAWVLLARMATLKAIPRHENRQFNPDAKEHHWGKRKLKRDQ
jgi:hypothetical protein